MTISGLTKSKKGIILSADSPITFIINMVQEKTVSKGIYENLSEAYIVVSLLRDLIKVMKVHPTQIGVIVSYNSQKNVIFEMIKKDKSFGNLLLNVDNLSISTIDSFQGREKEVIIFATTRSNMQDEIGFLRDERRFNVAITRAKRALIVIGNIKTFGQARHKHLESFVKDAQDPSNKILVYDSKQKSFKDIVTNEEILLESAASIALSKFHKIGQVCLTSIPVSSLSRNSDSSEE